MMRQPKTACVLSDPSTPQPDLLTFCQPPWWQAPCVCQVSKARVPALAARRHLIRCSEPLNTWREQHRVDSMRTSQPVNKQ
jgi:hypothetical protein